MTETLIGLLRHGQTDWNIEGLLQGVSDIPLNQTGETQAARAAEILRREDWDIVLASPLSRAIATAKAFTNLHALPEPVIEPMLTERAFGAAEGWTYLQWRAAHDNHEVIEGAESIEALEARALRLLDSIAMNYAGKRVLAVSHGAMIRSLVRVVTNHELPREGDRFGNTSLTKLGNVGGEWRLIHFDGRPLAEI
ncbi:MAG: hypothetical protein RLZZ400_289 [Actinomycetota bacterium]|jgi:broad specificity phosphatase PhoE